MASFSRAWATVLALVLIASGFGSAPLAATEGDAFAFGFERPAHAFGLRLPGPDSLGRGAYPAPPAFASDAPGAPGRLWAVAEVSLADVLPEIGAPAQLGPVTDALTRLGTAEGAPAVLVVRGDHPRYGRYGAQGFEAPDAGGDAEAALALYRHAWADGLREIARATRGRVAFYLLEDALPSPGTPDDVRLAQFDMKSAAVALRAENPQAGVAFLLPSEASLDLAERAYAFAPDLEPYVDGFALALDPAADIVPPVERLRALLRERDPGASLWVSLDLARVDAAGIDEATVLARAAASAAAGADLTLFALPPAGVGDAPDAVQGGAALGILARELGPDLGLSRDEDAALSVEAGSPPLRWKRFFDGARFREVIVYWSTDPQLADDAQASLLVDPLLRRRYETLALDGGPSRFVRTTEVGDDRVRLTLPLSRAPRLLLIQRDAVQGGFEGDLGDSEVRGGTGITAEEVIAAHQRARAFQDDRLTSVMRDGQISLRIRYAQVTGTFNITFRGDYLWRQGVGAEWVLRETLFDGVKLDWDKIPELPLLSQERVVQLPLDLELDKRYAYELDGEGEADGRDCYILRFRPLDEGLSLYRGRAWIDKATAALVQVTSVQTNLAPPLISDETTQIFRPFEGADGTRFWLLDEVKGQQIYTISGGNLVVLREATFGPPAINRPDFDNLQAEIYESDAQMLRETPEGLKWLSKDENGQRFVNEKGDPTQLFGAIGALKDESTTEGVLPLAGINYTDVDFLGRGKILNVFFAGVIANVSYSDPSLFGTRADFGIALNAVGIAGTDRIFRFDPGRDDIVEIENENVSRVANTLTFDVGVPLSEFFKLRGSVGVQYVNFQRAEETAFFTVPEDHFETSGLLELAYDRRGWGFLVQSRTFRRSDWAPWGNDGALVTALDAERAETFSTWTAGIQKAWFLPFFQQIEVQARYQAGNDLDRFSAFSFGLLSGDRLRGFAGSGLRYESGVLASLQYEFTLSEAIRFDATIDHARIDELGTGITSNHTGVGVAASFVGPWRTIIRFDVGYALASDLEAVEGDTEFLLLVLRLF